MSNNMRGNIALFLAAFIWGTTFVAQAVGMDNLGPFTYAGARYFLGVFSLLLVLYLFRGSREDARRKGTYKSGYLRGLQAGLIMFVATSLQQIALQYTTAGKTAFITCLYIVLVPICAALSGSKIRPNNWAGAFLAVTGLYFLSLQGEINLNVGDLIVLISAFFWTFQILFIGRFAALVDPIELSAAQISVCAILSTVAAFVFETPDAAAVAGAWVAIFYGGVMSAGVAFTLQIIGQRYAEPAPAAIIMSFESIFGALAGWLLLGEVMSGKEIFGCVLMTIGVVVTQAQKIKFWH